MAGFSDGINEFRRKLERMKENAEDLHGMQIFPDNPIWSDFVRRHSRFDSLPALIAASPATMNADGKLVGDEDEWQAFLKAETPFASWDEMRNAMVSEYAARKIMS